MESRIAWFDYLMAFPSKVADILSNGNLIFKEESPESNNWAEDLRALPSKVHKIMSSDDLSCKGQCTVFQFLVYSVLQYVVAWRYFEEEILLADAVGKALVSVLNGGVEILQLCAEPDKASPGLILTIRSSLGRFYEIIDDVCRYSQMINRLISKNHLTTFKLDLVKQLMSKVELDCKTLQMDLTLAYQEDLNKESPTSGNIPKDFIPWIDSKDLFLQKKEEEEEEEEGDVVQGVWRNFPIAVKHFPPPFSFDEELYVKLMGIGSAHLVQIIGHFERGLVLEQMKTDLGRILELGHITLLQSVDIMLQAMKHLHDNNMVYKVKTSNILVNAKTDGSFIIKVTGFDPLNSEKWAHKVYAKVEVNSEHWARIQAILAWEKANAKAEAEEEAQIQAILAWEKANAKAEAEAAEARKKVEALEALEAAEATKASDSEKRKLGEEAFVPQQAKALRTQALDAQAEAQAEAWAWRPWPPWVEEEAWAEALRAEEEQQARTRKAHARESDLGNVQEGLWSLDFNKKLDVFEFGKCSKSFMEPYDDQHVKMWRRLRDLLDGCLEHGKHTFAYICEELWLIKEKLMIPKWKTGQNETRRKIVHVFWLSFFENLYVKDLPIDQLGHIILPCIKIDTDGNVCIMHEWNSIYRPFRENDGVDPQNKPFGNLPQDLGLVGQFKKLLIDQGKTFNLSLGIQIQCIRGANSLKFILDFLEVYKIFNGIYIQYHHTMKAIDVNMLEQLRKALPGFTIGLSPHIGILSSVVDIRSKMFDDIYLSAEDLWLAGDIQSTKIIIDGEHTMDRKKMLEFIEEKSLGGGVIYYTGDGDVLSSRSKLETWAKKETSSMVGLEKEVGDI